jgi:hypothetical protein
MNSLVWSTTISYAAGFCIIFLSKADDSSAGLEGARILFKIYPAAKAAAAIVIPLYFIFAHLKSN